MFRNLAFKNFFPSKSGGLGSKISQKSFICCVCFFFFWGYTKLSFFLHERRLEDLEDEKEGYNKMISLHYWREKGEFFSLYGGRRLGTSARKMMACVYIKA